MAETKTELQTICDKIVNTFLDQLAETKDFEKIAVRLKEEILNKKPTEASIRSALFDEEIP